MSFPSFPRIKLFFIQTQAFNAQHTWLGFFVTSRSRTRRDVDKKRQVLLFYTFLEALTHRYSTEY